MKFLICSDGSAQAENAVRFGGLIAAASSAEVTLLGISEHPGESNALLDSLKRGQQLLADRKVAVELVSKSGHPVEEILKRTQETHYDLIVIGAVRKGMSGPFWMSAKAYKIIKETKPSVLTVVGNRSTLKRILICTGGRQYIEKAIALAGQIAVANGAVVCLFHVLPEPPAIYSDLMKREVDVELVLNSQSELGENLRREKMSLEQFGVQVEVRLEHGIVHQEILTELRRGQYDMVITGSSLAAGPVQTYIMGDVTREIVNRADCPVLVVRGAEGIRGLLHNLKNLYGKAVQTFGTPKPPVAPPGSK